ncbi:hypothetical protein [Lysobacter arvi]|uniref:Uncharacterized protein n=1 Tax=Lysobacter arvi TaxID=3038776 RepID=A0ABU1CD94_9GAMM|nr:hypothetical protein [Lysobacter arvi]MDR0183156.1 hypothetical protein [Lysobacter arvi]
MSTRQNDVAAFSPVAVPRWPGLRHVDAIERDLRRLGPSRRQALLDAVAMTLDSYVAGTAQRIGSGCVDLDAELDEVLRRLGPIGSKADAGGAIA